MNELILHLQECYDLQWPLYINQWEERKEKMTSWGIRRCLTCKIGVFPLDKWDLKIQFGWQEWFNKAIDGYTPKFIYC